MKIAVVAFEDLNDIKIWASIPYFIINELRKQGATVSLVGNIKSTKNTGLELAKRFYYNRLLKRSKGIYRTERNNHHLKKKALMIEKELEKIDYDLVLSFFPYQTAFLTISKPIVIWTDATFKLLHQHYPSYKDFHLISYQQSIRIEEMAMENASLLIYCSQWAASSSINDFNNLANKVKVIPFGANLSHENIAQTPSISNSKPLELLFIGFDAERKGLRKAIIVTNYLNDEGIKANLTVVGPISLMGYDTKNVHLLGRLDKDNLEDVKKLDNAYQNAHFFMLFPSCEAYGIVFCEAASYGLPSVSHNTGGVSEIIKDGINGHKFNQDSSAKAVGDLLLSYINDAEKYDRLRQSCLDDYRDRLNWKASIQQLLKHLEELKRES